MSKEDIDYCNGDTQSKNKDFAVLVYETPHRRSQETLLRLAGLGKKGTVIVLDWEPRDNFKPIHDHRPGPILDIKTAELAKNLGFPVQECTHAQLHATLKKANPSLVLLAGARLIDKKTTEAFTIINSHPAYLPYSRGLDALKWAILKTDPIGVTSHIINEEIDAGQVIRQEIITVDPNEDFGRLAARQFDLECKLLVEALEDIKTSPLQIIDTQFYTPNRRMPHRLEEPMLRQLEHRKLKNATRR